MNALWSAFSLLAILGQQTNQVPSEGMALELKALEARRSLRNGVVELSVEYHKSNQPSSISAFDLRIHFDGNRRHAERRGSTGTGIQLRMFDGNKYVRAIGEDDTRIVIDSRGVAGTTYLLLDPTLLGVFPIQFASLSSNRHSLEEVLGRNDRSDEQVSTEEMFGQSVIHVSRKVHSGRTSVDLWIAPHLDYSVVKAVAADSLVHDEVFSELVERFGNVWFPKRITYRRYGMKDKALLKEEIITVKSAVFNQGVDQSLFDLAAFKPLLGEVIKHDGKPLAWNGKGLIPAYGPEARSLASPSRIWRWPWFAAAVLLAMVAFFLLRRWLLSVRDSP